MVKRFVTRGRPAGRCAWRARGRERGEREKKRAMPEVACASATMHNVGSFTWWGVERGGTLAGARGNVFAPDYGWKRDRVGPTGIRDRPRREGIVAGRGRAHRAVGRWGTGRRATDYNGARCGVPREEWRTIAAIEGREAEARERERSGIARVARCATKEQWGVGARERDGWR